MFFGSGFLIEPELTDASLNSEIFYKFQKPYNNTGDGNWYPATMAKLLSNELKERKASGNCGTKWLSAAEIEWAKIDNLFFLSLLETLDR